jgi:hypothetical protein
MGDQEIPDEEWTAAKLLDAETDWREVPARFLDGCDAALSHVSPKSWHFHLPAYMKRALELRDTLHTSDLPGWVIFHLTHDRKQLSLTSYTLERFTQLTPEKIRAVVAFLDYFNLQRSERDWDADRAREALNSYWALPPDKRPYLETLETPGVAMPQYFA